MKVSLAKRSDLGHVERIGTAAMTCSFSGLLADTTLSSWLDAAYSPAALARRWQDHPMFLAWLAETPIAFADAWVADSHIVLSALFTTPSHRRKGAASSLVGHVAELAPRLPMTSDLILGCHDAECFFERCGFVPGESLEVMLFGERVVERRWYREPAEDHAGHSRSVSAA
ncbi:MAG: GNAT family N-acetyltransferase [Acidimicrobiia bacterium]|nr:GNAT family N-acetyltransferase [Acidimicrobiia bacterium]